ncbi:hypothetical protein, partial [Pseudomonas sp.]|uniref:hypothetical protein n=1 Tax=Pseudomonas sp. TaxID=306 RepID=UPI0028ADA1DF
MKLKIGYVMSACISDAHSLAIVAHNHLFAFTASHFLSNATKSNQKTLRSYIRPLRFAPGFPHSGVLRALRGHNLLRKS